jgi:hypothetical protein
MTALKVVSPIFVFSQMATTLIKVYGNCGVSKTGFEKALNVDRVINASWDLETKLLIVSYVPAKISNDSIQKDIAAKGHDTEKSWQRMKLTRSFQNAAYMSVERKNKKIIQLNNTNNYSKE